MGLPTLIYAHIITLQVLFRRILTKKSISTKSPSKIFKITLIQLPYNSYSLHRTTISMLSD